ncbi:MAG: TRAP transporter large permease [Hyphomonadaceae bacterium]|nr:TRAP transporter large permease [Hyphomonadaceae bacterium]
MELIVLFGALAVLLALGVPVAFALGAASLATFVFLDIPPIVAFQQMAAGMSAFSLLAIPFFVFTGELMTRSGIADRIVDVATALFGRSRGGLGQVSVGAAMMFGSVSGSAVATVSAVGATLIPKMKAEGYGADYAVNVMTCAAILGVLVPPSHNMILYAASAGAGVSVVDLFLAGVIPALATGLALMIAARWVAARRGYKAGVFPGWRALARALAGAAPGFMIIVIIFGGILGGVFTPTESSAIAVVYTAIVARLVYRALGAAAFARAVAGAVQTTAMVMLIIGAAASFGWLLALTEFPQTLANGMAALTDNPIATLLLINLILLVLGTFMDMAPLIIIGTPIFLPVAMDAGMDPVQFGVVMLLNQGIGLVTPPVGSVQFVGCGIGKIRMEDAMRTIWPFYAALFAALMLVTYVPAASLWLPGLLR